MFKTYAFKGCFKQKSKKRKTAKLQRQKCLNLPLNAYVFQKVKNVCSCGPVCGPKFFPLTLAQVNKNTHHSATTGVVHAVVRSVVHGVPRFVSNLFIESLFVNKLVTNHSMNKLRTKYPRTIIRTWFYEQITHEIWYSADHTAHHSAHHTCGRAVVRFFVHLRYVVG